MTDQTLANDVATDATENDSQAQATKTYTQAEVDANMMVWAIQNIYVD